MLLAAITLLFALIRGWKLRWWAVASLSLAVALALSPIDFVIRSRGREIGFRFLPVAFGFASQEDTINYGCMLQRNPPKWAIVLFI